MKTLIYFLSCFSLLALVGCSPEEKCFDAQMKVWDLSKVYKNQKGIDNWGWYDNDATGKAQFEADAWARCMKR